ncbi:MAG: hypothetical protein E7632_09480 [Ruminococcaceae bacterium]|nr:hypothetical protein [Oscillospiraceae bacterium]
MKIAKQSLSALLLLSMLASMAACASDTPPDTGNDTTEPVETTTADTEDPRATMKDNLPDDLDFGGEVIRFYCRGAWATEEFSEETENGDIVNDAQFNRNRQVEERLNVKLEFTAGETKIDDYGRKCYSILLAGDNEFEVMQCFSTYGSMHANEGLFADLMNAPYLDYDMPWYDVTYMNELAVSPNHRYLLMGDLCFKSIQNLSSVFYNKALYEQLYGNPDELYDKVLDGTWTHDVMRKICADIYSDTNGNTETDKEDRLGMIVGSGTQSDNFTFTSGFRFTDRSIDGYPQLVIDHSRNVDVLESLDNLFHETVGVICNLKIPETDSFVKFTEGTSMFLPERLVFTGYDVMREMNDPYGVLPFPKLDENQERYYTLINNSSTLTAVPVTVPNDKFDAVCATLEALYAESYRKVTPAYYEIVLKVKFAHDDQSRQIIDLIRDSLTSDFAYSNATSLSNLGYLPRDVLWKHDSSYMSMYESKKTTVSQVLKQIIEDVQKAD